MVHFEDSGKKRRNHHLSKTCTFEIPKCFLGHERSPRFHCCVTAGPKMKLAGEQTQFEEKSRFTFTFDGRAGSQEPPGGPTT